MKRILCLTLALLLFCGCGSKELDSVWLQADAFTAAAYPTNFKDFLHLKSSGDCIVGAKYNSEGAIGSLYQLSLEGGAVQIAPFSSTPALASSDLLGVDGQGGVWIAGTDSRLHSLILRLDETGQETLQIDLGTDVPGRNVFGFTWDEDHYYFLAYFWSTDPSEYMQCNLLVYDHQGQALCRRPLKEDLVSTAGYLPREAEWLEELEGRDEDYLLSMMYPEGPQDTVGLLRLQDGTPALFICRKSPIDAERYGIICPLDKDFSAAPVCYYPIEATSGADQLCTYFESQFPAYGLLVSGADGLKGLSLSDGSTTPLVSWSALEVSATTFASTQPCVPDTCCSGPDGALWMESWAESGYVYTVLTPTE